MAIMGEREKPHATAPDEGRHRRIARASPMACHWPRYYIPIF